MALLDRIADKQDGAEYPPIFRIAILSALADLLSESSINAYVLIFTNLPDLMSCS